VVRPPQVQVQVQVARPEQPVQPVRPAEQLQGLVARTPTVQQREPVPGRAAVGGLPRWGRAALGGLPGRGAAAARLAERRPLAVRHRE
jgi:hypothetical protein